MRLWYSTHRRLVRVAQPRRPRDARVLAQVRTDPIRRHLQCVLAAGDEPRNQDGQRHAQIVEFEVQVPRRTITREEPLRSSNVITLHPSRLALKVLGGAGATAAPPSLSSIASVIDVGDEE